ncbi:vascular endothelial growth factor receptor kdr-like [Lycorma delicatula]|uniref:vascular endothelial growth factor receptor kdr-like n=1 Tax=Lycorma delicatula TaxID=130591 RepID=UPI003F511806
MFIILVLLTFTATYSECEIQIKIDKLPKNGVITKENDIVIHSGDDLELTCTGDKPLQWYYPDINERSSNVNTNDEFTGSVYSSKLKLQKSFYMDTGYFMCHPAGINDSNDTASYYVYVKDDEHLLAVNESLVMLNQHQYKSLVIACRPTSPDVNVTLKKDEQPVDDIMFDPHVGFMKDHALLSDSGHYSCEAIIDKDPEIFYLQVLLNTHVDTVEKPTINASVALIGGNAELDCSVSVAAGVIVTLDWVPPNLQLLGNNHIEITNATKTSQTSSIVKIIESKKLIIHNVTKEDEGKYICNVTDSSFNTNQAEHLLKVFTSNTTYLNLTTTGSTEFIARGGVDKAFWSVRIDSYPSIRNRDIIWYDRSNKIIDQYSGKYEVLIYGGVQFTKLTVLHLSVLDSGTYRLEVTNGFERQSVNLSLLVEGKPHVALSTEKYYSLGESIPITCNVTGHPEPKITWHFEPCRQFSKCLGDFIEIDNDEHSEKHAGIARIDSVLTINATASGVLKCRACNILGCTSETDHFTVTDIDNGFGIIGPKKIVAGDSASLICRASIIDFNSHFDWEFPDASNKQVVRVKNNTTEYSYQSILEMINVTTDLTGAYHCYAVNSEDNRKKSVIHWLEVQPEVKPSVIVSFKNESDAAVIGHTLEWECEAEGSPLPKITWLKDSVEIRDFENSNSDSTYIPRVRVSQKYNISTLIIDEITEEDAGYYTCKAESRVGSTSKSTVLNTMHASPQSNKASFIWIVLFCIIVLLFAFIIIFLIRRVRKERAKRKQITNGLRNFEQGQIGSINPDLDLAEQADLLPYNKKFEFPRKKLKLGKQLGSGAFGVVLKGEADGILEPDVVTTVAVKMVKQNVDETHIVALASELKIMIHLGRHLNVVNLLAACTRNLSNHELLVIVEYCPYGNLHKFLQSHRETFINQVNPITGRIDPTIIKSSPKLKYVNIPISNSTTGTSQSNGITSRLGSMSEDSQQINSIGTEMTSISSTPVGEDGYLICRDPPQEWKQSRNNIQQISTQDLLCWSFQIARGMEYLASRKVLHGDLAARNVLLAENNIVKICDFGLSKNMYMYKNDNYFKKGKRLLPVKWMALEAIRDRNFSIQSDVWAYGIVLWELFSLARTPYPGIEDVERLYQKLEEGFRMEKPEYATKDLYDVMLDCWQERPSMRPSFTGLAEKLGDMLEDSVRKHYVDLNDPFLKENAEFLSQQDYLSMLSSPTYVNLNRENDGTPNPATPGYVCMKQRKKTDAQEETELRPMLNSLASKGSSSDIDSAPNSPSPTTSPPANFVSVAEATASHGFSNPTYHNLGRPPINPYMNTPYVIEKEGKPYGVQWNSSNSGAE